MTLLGAARYPLVAAYDTAQNRVHRAPDGRFLVVRDPSRRPFFYSILLRWLATYFPPVRARLELRTLAGTVRDWSSIAVHVPWLQDPVQAWSAASYSRANDLAAQCDQRGVPVVNRVDRLANAGKATAAELIGRTGLRTPRMALVDNAEAFRETRLGVPLPLFVREDWGHGGPMVRADTDADVRAMSLEGFRRPVAVELIELPGADGLFRKYRYVVAGDIGVAQTVHLDPGWCVRGSSTLFSDAIRAAEVSFMQRPEPNHDRFVAAREALGLDFVAFDYGISADGEAVVWEANPYPFLHVTTGRRDYRNASTARVLAAMATLYLHRAGLPVPDELEAAARTPPP